MKICLILAYTLRHWKRLFFHAFKNKRTKLNNTIKEAKIDFFSFFVAKNELEPTQFHVMPQPKEQKNYQMKAS